MEQQDGRARQSGTWYGERHAASPGLSSSGTASWWWCGSWPGRLVLERRERSAGWLLGAPCAPALAVPTLLLPSAARRRDPDALSAAWGELAIEAELPPARPPDAAMATMAAAVAAVAAAEALLPLAAARTGGGVPMELGGRGGRPAGERRLCADRDSAKGWPGCAAPCGEGTALISPWASQPLVAALPAPPEALTRPPGQDGRGSAAASAAPCATLAPPAKAEGGSCAPPPSRMGASAEPPETCTRCTLSTVETEEEDGREDDPGREPGGAAAAPLERSAVPSEAALPEKEARPPLGARQAASGGGAGPAASAAWRCCCSSSSSLQRTA